MGTQRGHFRLPFFWNGRICQWIGFSDLCVLFGRLFRQRYRDTNGTWSHTVNLLRRLLSSSDEQRPAQVYTTSDFCCFFTKSTMPSIFNLFFLFSRLSKNILELNYTRCMCLVKYRVANVKSKSNEVPGSKIVDWCSSAVISLFLEFQVGRTMGGGYVYYLYWTIQLPLYCIPYKPSYSFREPFGSQLESKLWIWYTCNALLQKSRSTCKIDCVEGILNEFFSFLRFVKRHDIETQYCSQ